MEDIDASEGLEQQQQQCDGQKRPGTPDHSGEKGALSTLGGLENEYREALQIYEESKATRSFLVELGVGWTVDPRYAVGKNMTVFCPIEEKWHYCTTQKYSEETGIHEIQFSDGKTIELPLLGLRVRFLLNGGSSPETPSFSRKMCIYQIVSTGIEKGIYKKGYLPGIQYGLSKLEEALVHDAHYITEHQSTSKGDELEMASKLIVGQEKIIQKYRKNQPHYLAFPHWLQDRTFFPGELVWVKFRSYKEWPCIVVSPDHIVDNIHGCYVKRNRKLTFAYFLGSYERVTIDSGNVVSFADGLLKGYHRGKPKTHEMSYKIGLEESKNYAKVRVTYVIFVHTESVVFNVVWCVAEWPDS